MRLPDQVMGRPACLAGRPTWADGCLDAGVLAVLAINAARRRILAVDGLNLLLADVLRDLRVLGDETSVPSKGKTLTPSPDQASVHSPPHTPRR
jgi:hypothetical protein